jgi:competence protein ComEC
MPEVRIAHDFERHPALWLASSFSIGICIASLAGFDLVVTATVAAMLAFAAVVMRRSPLAPVLILSAFVFAGSASYTAERTGIPQNRIRALYDSGLIRSGEPVEIEGVMTGGPEPSNDGVFLNLQAEKLSYQGREADVTGRVRLFLPDRANTADTTYLTYGSRIRVPCSLEREDEYLNPGVTTRREILDRIGIDATGSIKSALLIEKLADESVFQPLAWVYDQRARIIDEMRANVSQPAAGIMIASLLGDKYFLDKTTAELFRDGGTFHILVISGLHITFIGGLLLVVVGRFTKDRWLRFIIPATILWSYTLAVGADLPVVRAAVMFTIISFSFVIYRQRTLLNSLGLCALLLLAWRPSELFNPSFQLTFVSVAAILALAYPLIEVLRRIGAWMPSAEEPFPPNVPNWLKRFCEMLYWNEDAWSVEMNRQIWSTRLFKKPLLESRIVGASRKAIRYLFEGFVVSLIVQIWMLPLLVIYFHRVSLASIGLNIWVGFFIAIESFVVIAGVLLNRLSSFIALPLFELVDIINWIMLSIPRLFSHGGLASFRLPAYSGAGRLVYLFYLGPVVLLAFAAYRWQPFALEKGASVLQPRILYGAFCLLLIFGGMIILHPFSAPAPDGRLHIDFLDVGQGDSALVTFPDGRTLLVDAGGKFSYGDGDDREDGDGEFKPDIRGIGESVVSEYLWHRGYSHVDWIMASHADADHIQGLGDVAANFSVESAIFGRTPWEDADFSELAKVLDRRRIPITTVSRGDRLTFGDVTVEVLSPYADDGINSMSANDSSVVLRIVYGRRAFMLTGDIERRAEAELVASAGTLTADLVKAAHHGSRTSSTQEFVDAINADYVIISVGRSSPFGHPHPEVVERWRAHGAKVMTTGERGTISVSTDGSDLAIDTFLP